MDFFTIIGLSAVIYILVYFIVLSATDCDLGLLWALYTGRKLDYFKDKVVWITGASSGIGEFLAVELAKNGASLIISARSASNLDRVKKRCLDVGTPVNKILVLPFDVTDYKKHEEMFLRATHHFGKLDILVNNAGRSQRAVWEDISTEVDREMFDLNVFSLISLSRLAVKYFDKNGGGHIVVSSSLAGIFGAPFSATYTATKHALHGYFKSLRMEKLGTKLAITLLCPGPVFSNVLSQSFTGKSGEIFGQEMLKDDKRMQTSRCAFLYAVAIANHLDEAWVGLFPSIPLCYILVYFPNIAKKLALLIGTKQLMKLRDSRQVMNTNKND
ncbi:dehydrogenase/reductase SDR family member 7 [Cimex lectularius]|uniref:Dehydrogenase/reductase SDR family member 7 n=1 Tax=Cimex lectularius TaxID=79782 RepID=A0A8I6RG90_CIMLE|nr:dehydrogenase/reductase SDR family member 7 [Cimex lectularius]